MQLHAAACNTTNERISGSIDNTIDSEAVRLLQQALIATSVPETLDYLPATRLVR
jgi:hypothetical protein